VSSEAQAAGLTPELAAKGFIVVNGQVVRRLGKGGPNQFVRANSLVAATEHVPTTPGLVYVGWALLLVGAMLVPPVAVTMVRRRRAVAGVGVGQSTSGEV
jgi:hypothetical protein